MAANTTDEDARLGVEPLTRALEAIGGFPSRELEHVSRLSRSYQRAVRRGSITPAQADELCTRILGCHPAEVYGQQWWDAEV